MDLPKYETFFEGVLHAPQFRSRVQVDGTWYLSPNTFPNIKRAEQDAAKVALVAIREKVKNEGRSRILEDTILCKSIVHEYAVKMKLGAPTYEMTVSEPKIPMFVSSIVLNGVTFVGDAGKNKKEAEQFAARAAIVSILESESGTTMSEIVRSKFKFYDALKEVKDSSNAAQDGVVPAELNQAEKMDEVISFNEGKEVEVCERTVTAPLSAIPQSAVALSSASQVALSDKILEQPSIAQGGYQYVTDAQQSNSTDSDIVLGEKARDEKAPLKVYVRRKKRVRSEAA